MLTESIMYVWVSDLHLAAVTALMAEWGFRYRGSLVWVKPRRGLGEYVISQHETVRVYVRGDFPAPPTNLRPTSLIVAEALPNGLFRAAPPRDDRHSAKPDRLYEMIEAAYPQYFTPECLAKPMALELFARSYRPGWDGQGYEYPGRPADEAAMAA